MTELTMTYRPVPARTTFTVKDPYSALTHFIGIIYSALLSPVIMTHAIYREADTLSLISTAVFMISMVLLYTASTLYHTIEISDHCTRILKKIDHCMIFVLIAGSYTPVCLIALRSGIGPRLLLFVWAFALLGILFKLCWVTCPKWVSSVIYISLGWSCLVAFPSLLKLISPAAFFWLLFGGIVYTAGGVIYALKLKAFNAKTPDFGSHELFHVFVMIGNLAQFVCIWMML